MKEIREPKFSFLVNSTLLLIVLICHIEHKVMCDLSD